jgi:hypothetical protein
MENENFLQACELINSHLHGLEVNDVLNSIGSHVFFYFGNIDEESVFPNGRKYARKEWGIWVGNASWRITKNGKYLVGSGDNRDEIALGILKLVDKSYQSLQFLSTFLDVEFTFEDGYQLTTFFNWMVEDQWTIFLPKRFQIEPIGTDCSISEEIKKVQILSKNFPTNEKYTEVDFLLPDRTVTAFSYDPYNRPQIHFEDDCSIQFENCMWRLEKDSDYIFGYLDHQDVDFKGELSKLIGKKLLQVDTANSMMDGRFQFEEGYVLKTFTCNHSNPQWHITSKSRPIFEANILFAED